MAYFGRPLGPEQLLLAPWELADTVTGALSSHTILIGPLASVLAPAALLIWMFWNNSAGLCFPRWLATTIVLMVIAIVTANGLFQTKPELVIATRASASTFGVIQTAVAAGRSLLFPVRHQPDIPVAQHTVNRLPIGNEPQTVVVIMGESISAARLSVLGFQKNTTPILSSWLHAAPAGLTLLAKSGFSSGNGTMGSVPAFLKMSYSPIAAEWQGVNLFSLARSSDFESWYFSAQSQHFLEMAGGAPHARRIVAVQSGLMDKAEFRDDVLVELMTTLPSSNRRFVFIHQRVNHTPYARCANHVPEQALSNSNSKTEDDLRRNEYDRGLRCWDVNVAQVVSTVANSAGAINIFITADHAEMMGQDGQWGHGYSDLRVAAVPMILLTNRPDSNIAKQFLRQDNPVTGFTFALLVAQALGSDVTAANFSPDRFFINSTFPFGRAGCYDVKIENNANYSMRSYSRQGALIGTYFTEAANVLSSPP